MKPLMVTLVYDLEGWVLHQIAEKIKQHAERPPYLTFRLRKNVRKRKNLIPLIKGTDVLHILTPGLFSHFGPALSRPSVITLHHVADKLEHSLTRRADLIDVLTAINGECADFIRNSPETKDHTLFMTPFGLDTGFWRHHSDGRAQLLKHLGYENDTILLGLAAKPTSNEDNRKGLDRYWELLKKLRSEYGDRVKLLIFGPGEDRERGWRYTMAPEEVRSSIRIMGFIDAPLMPVYMSGLDFYICLSRNEGGPHPVMEAMACQTPTVSTLVGFVPELITEGESGYLVNEDNYLEKIPELIRTVKKGSEATLALGEAARASIIAKRSWENLVTFEKYYEIYAKAKENYDKRSVFEKFARYSRLAIATKRPWII